MLIHNLRCSVQLIIIAKGDKKIFEKTHCVPDDGAANNSVRVIVAYAVMAIWWSDRRNLHCDVKGFFSLVTRSG